MDLVLAEQDGLEDFVTSCVTKAFMVQIVKECKKRIKSLLFLKTFFLFNK